MKSHKHPASWDFLAGWVPLCPNAKSWLQLPCEVSTDLSCKFGCSWNCWNLPKVLWELAWFCPLIYLYFVGIVLSSFDECKTCLSHCLRTETVVECSHLLLFICPASTWNITNLNVFPVPCSVPKINMFRGGDNRWEVEAYISTLP